MTYKYFIKSVDEYVLRFSSEQLQDNPYITGTLFHQVFFSNKFLKKTELHLQYSGDIIKILIPLIREGVLYLPDICEKYQSGNYIQDIIDINKEYIWSELSKLLEYVACDNEYYHKLCKIMQNGAMDLLGRKIHFSHIKKISNNDFNYLLPYDKKQCIFLKSSFLGKLNASMKNIKITPIIKKTFPKILTITLENIEKSMYNGILNRLESIQINIQIRPKCRRIIIYTIQDNKIWNNQEEYIDVIVKHFIVAIDNTVKLLDDYGRVKN
ncbi:hypothetical protein QJ854_gp793 [Moumouvirus goulette]|uniref:DUF5866 domain-containing protein n=1 Tax=Moumouvirus goulette TaxID=1247379 RepID=M1PAW1_9VIRU|nr:hypothetical protein QJ854_gp793 [Moumouvirus goulette]AGF84989.1 hypothetical protein glt_00180 [Moumouvirus goulette]